MWPYHPELLARPVPRYTSYPTAADFSGAVGPSDMAAALACVGTGDALSLYVHIPFCHSICWYCGCNTGAANRAERLANYLAALMDEIALVAGRLNGRGRVRRIAYGGGSPNALTPAQFRALHDSIAQAFHLDDPTISVEIDPRSLTREFVDAMQAIGTVQASLGVQTFSPHIQSLIGRVQPIEMIERATQWLREAGVCSLNFDLMYGLPAQQLDDLDSSIDHTARLGADRIAIFGYAHVPDLLPRQRRIDASALPDVDTRFAQAAHGHARLAGLGYQPVGFDHFALPGDPMARAAREGRLHRNFQGFTDDDASILIGLGASAISEFPGLLLQNEKNAGRYRMCTSAGRLAQMRGVRRCPAVRARGRIIERLLCDLAADLPPLEDWARIEQRLTPFLDKGLARLDGSRLVIAPDALPYARAIAACFDNFRDLGPGQFSNAI